MDGIVALVGRNLQADMEASAQLLAYRELDASRREQVRSRLMAVDAYRVLDKPTRADAEAAGARLGIGARAFYDLLKKVARDGPVLGSIPHRRKARPASKARDGLGGAAERAIQFAIARTPNAPTTSLVAIVQAAAREVGEEVPTAMSVSRRIEALVQGARGRHLRVGHSVAVLQVPLRLTVEGLAPQPLIATMVVDMGSRLILSAAHEGYGEFSLHSAVLASPLVDRITRIAGTDLPFDCRGVGRLYWAVPPDMEDLRDPWIEDVARRVPGLKAVAEVRSSMHRTLIGPKGIGRVNWATHGTSKRDIANWPTIRQLDSSPFDAAVAGWNRKVMATDRRRARLGIDKGSAFVDTLQKAFGMFAEREAELAIRRRRQLLAAHANA